MGIAMWGMMRDAVGYKQLPSAHQRIESKLLFILLVKMKPFQIEHVSTEITATVSKQWLGNDVEEKIPFSVCTHAPAPHIPLEIYEKNSKYETGNTQVSMACSFYAHQFTVIQGSISTENTLYYKQCSSQTYKYCHLKEQLCLTGLLNIVFDTLTFSP